MALAIAHSRGLDGLNAPPVTVEAHLASGLPSFTLVGLPDTEVKEARDRVRAAIAIAKSAKTDVVQIDAVFEHDVVRGIFVKQDSTIDQRCADELRGAG